MLPTFDSARGDVVQGCTLAILAHRPEGLDKRAMWTRWQQLIARFMGVAPADLAIVRSGDGKPLLASPARLYFNASYGRRWSLLVLSRGGELGCDVEDRLAADDHEKLSPIVLHANEQTCIAALPPRDRAAAFARCWVRKEAILKAGGTGFREDPRCIDVRATVQSANAPILGWQLHELPSAPVPLAVCSRDQACAWFMLQDPP
jgi:phosphopantetheinyl transferase